MPLGALLPILPFVALLFTRLWLAATLSAAAGVAAGWWIMRLPASAPGDWWWWVELGYAAVVNLAMAIAETVVAAVVLRGRIFRGLGFAVLAHAAWLAWLFLWPHATSRSQLLLLLMTAMIGAAGATLGAARARR